MRDNFGRYAICREKDFRSLGYQPAFAWRVENNNYYVLVEPPYVAVTELPKELMVVQSSSVVYS